MNEPRNLDLQDWVNNGNRRYKMIEEQKMQARRNKAALGKAKIVQKNKKTSAKKVLIAITAIVAFGMYTTYAIAENNYIDQLVDAGVTVQQGSYSPTGGPEDDRYFDADGNEIKITFEKVVNHLTGNSDIDQIKGKSM